MRALKPLLALALLPTLSLSVQAGPLGDTGIQFCGAASSGNTACTSDPTGQDRRRGRDAAAEAGVLYKVGAGQAGFDYTRVCMSGELAGQGSCPANPSLGSGANNWACTRDNLTGLVWEVKTDDGGLRDKDHFYAWYNLASPDGDPGDEGQYFFCNSTLGADLCNTANYIAAVNALTGTDRLCGATDWRLPGVRELEGIAHRGRSGPAIDPDYFPNTPSSGTDTWSDTVSVGVSGYAWVVDFELGAADRLFRSGMGRIRLVRGGQ